MQRLRSAGLKTRIIHWTLDGEPFMNKRFHDVVAVAVRYGFNTHHFASNGYLMTLERLYQFPAEGQRYVVTPDFCSDEAYFETYRGTRGTWRRVLENICVALKDPGLSHFQFKVTDISSYTIRDPEALGFASLRARFARLPSRGPALRSERQARAAPRTSPTSQPAPARGGRRASPRSG